MAARPVLWTADEASAATGGHTSRPWTATGVSIDTRTLQPGDLYIALKGDRLDGHAYVAEAFAKGASAALVSHETQGEGAQLTVPDTLKGLRDLGAAARARSGAKIVGVTGSVGKTSTKEMLASALGALGHVHANRASFNNHWGVPLTLATLPAGADYGVIEMGMNHAGELRDLTRLTRPNVAIVTTVEAVHLEHFGTVEAIAAAKAEIFEGLEPGGVAIIPHDLPQRAILEAAARTAGATIRTFGDVESADARLTECLEASNGTRIVATILGQTVRFTLRLPGRHQAVNALAVLLAVASLGGNLDKAAQGIATLEPISGRGSRELLDLGDAANPVTLIDEAYNASPASMRAAFRVLALVDPGRGGRRIAILGDMLELGADAARLHAELALPLKAANVDLVYTCGPLMKHLHDTLPPEQRGAHRDTSPELAEIVPDVLAPGDVVMVKGSHGSRMDVVVEALRALPARRKETGRHAL